MLSLSEREKNGIKIIEKAASKKNAHFFIDSGEGREYSTDTISIMNMSGWLIPTERKSEFETISDDDRWNDTWDAFFCFAKWYIVDDEILIDFS